jgi:hypothetical protein
MSLQSLTPPQDVTWTRLAYSRDMIDKDFDHRLPPKWRSSMAIYYYIVPEEDSADAYPNSKIVYLKVTCSITGWNPYETLEGSRKVAEAAESFDDLQKSIWEAVMGSFWSSTYYPCAGAIMQVSIFPNGGNVKVDDYPYIMDFEPKKRELYEATTEGSELLSGTSDRVSITKGTTSVKNTEYGGSISTYIPISKSVGVGITGSGSKSNTTTSIDQNMTDTSREARETLSRTTSFSQMYQLFNGYHLGTNRAVFAVFPRPHTLSPSSVDFNLIRGQRKLEGIQEVFLVVHMPSSLQGFCVQASLETGHNVVAVVPPRLHYIFKMPEGASSGPHDPSSHPNPNEPIHQIVVTKRVIKSCGKFDENHNFTIVTMPDEQDESVSNEIAIAKTLPNTETLYTNPNKQNRKALVNSLNLFQQLVKDAIVNGVSSGKYSPKKFADTRVFKSLTALAVSDIQFPLNKLALLKYISSEEYQIFMKNNINTVGDLFQENASKIPGIEIDKIRDKILQIKKI